MARRLRNCALWSLRPALPSLANASMTHSAAGLRPWMSKPETDTILERPGSAVVGAHPLDEVVHFLVLQAFLRPTGRILCLLPS